ncbi:MAG: hypothetical protein B6D61_02515 [Bacteroidetes bacterium 4484_249]|nr:MAG: hypothetical protein B6D61_02515 [Bacteroidetes bacterium 4484_249]
MTCYIYLLKNYNQMFIDGNINTQIKRRTVYGISLGSSKRDHTGEIQIGWTHFKLIRKGTDGSIEKAATLFKQYDGKVDAFGLGGAVLNLPFNNHKYYFKELKQLSNAVNFTKIGDGNAVKGILSENALNAIKSEGIQLQGMKTLHMGAIDRYSQAEVLVKNGCDIVFGDFMFGMGLPIPVRSLKTMNKVGSIALPVITQLPFRWFYPIGKKQDKKPSQKFKKYFQESELIVGDYIWMKVNLPDDLSGKIILTNTTTADDVEELKRRGLKMLVTTTPRIDGRTFGTNIIEAMLLCLIDKSEKEITDEDFRELINKIPVRPNIEKLN